MRVFTAFILISFVGGCTKLPKPKPGGKIEINSLVAREITSYEFLTGGHIISAADFPITEKGVCWHTTSNPTVDNNFLVSLSSNDSFSIRVTGLLPNKTYFVRAYLKNRAGTFYGNQISAKTPASLATVNTEQALNITSTSATCVGNIVSSGGVNITARGLCWSTSPAPTTSDNKSNNGSGTGSFTSNLTGLTPNTVYYVRAYGINSIGTSYGNEISFRTQSGLPEVSTVTISSITTVSAVSGGNVISDGGSSVTQRGVCWSTSTTPTISNNVISSTTGGLGLFSLVMSGLNPGTNYYVRAFARNTNGISYGSEEVFRTISASAPTVLTSSATSIGYTTANVSGNVTSTGGLTLTQRGICWSTSSSPNINDSRTTESGQTGLFSSSLSGLIPGSTYYARAYATNSVGTAYGSSISFTTQALSAPVLTAPSNATTIGCCNINFSWNAVPGATGYEIQVSKTTSFSGTTYMMNTCGTSFYLSTTGYNSKSVNSLSYCINGGTSVHNGTWYWRVRALIGTYTGPWSTRFRYIYNY